jgi:hypothetical protein
MSSWEAYRNVSRNCCTPCSIASVKTNVYRNGNRCHGVRFLAALSHGWHSNRTRSWRSIQLWWVMTTMMNKCLLIIEFLTPTNFRYCC